ncbi:hypothetical protein AXF42_Ash002882 [Apostasia shenzhenica]|uniref:Bet v I/Major latex protein domain-containing protein n=1 Tax=Apostasia shenzhenica TaxID=1088818 RepID=A0A2I0A7N0_9ASPA|nr:hypothetical protein AXF42_Ash002882 [Apostasia shenzhenica]
MGSKLAFETKALVGIEAMWKAITKDKLKVLSDSASHLVSESRFLEGDEIALGSVVFISFGPALPHLEPFSEKVVEFDETSHTLSFLGISGGYMNRGFAKYVVTFVLGDDGDEKTLVTSTIIYDLKENVVDRESLLTEFAKVLRDYLQCVESHLLKNTSAA